MAAATSSGSQSVVSGHEIDVYASNGVKADSYTFPSSVANGSNQATILVAGEGYAATFPAGPSPDFIDTGLDIPVVGGAVCFPDGSPPDCVSWGNFTGDESLPSTAGDPVSPGGVTTGKALHRSIAEPCATLLEPGDDSNDSATDFSEQEPNPRSNSSPIVEHKCVAPSAVIDSGPSDPTNSTDASFEYHSEPEGADFECSLDFAAFIACEASGIEYAGPLAEGAHTFRVRAIDENGTGSPASYEWTIDLTLPEATIDEPKPGNGSPGASVSFFFHATNEAAASFECLLVDGDGEGAESFEECESGGSFGPLEDGLHTFKVRALDLAGNTGKPASHSWTVDNEAGDTAPPTAKIESAPPSLSESSTATFTYSANEEPVSFECRLDGGSFSPCPATGKTYEGLGDGLHTFAVIAIDAAKNASEPAGYSFDVVLPSVVTDPPPPLTPHVPPLPPEPPPGTLLVAGVANVKGDGALLRAHCRGQLGARCMGALRLIARVRAARTSRRRARNVLVGRTRYNLPAGTARTVRVRLNGRGKRLLRRAGRRGLRARLVGASVRNRVVKLRPSGRAKRRGRARR